MAQEGKNRITINLLPPEFMVEEIKKAKFYKIQAIGVGIILIMIFLSSLTVALRILQSYNISQIQGKLSKIEDKVSILKNRQASLVLLKDRLTAINQYWGQPSKQSNMYSILDKIIPISISVTALSVERTGDGVVSLIIPDSNTLDNLISSLISPDINQSKIKKISIENLNRGRDGTYRLSLKIIAN